MEFETATFMSSRNVFLRSPNFILTLDDDLFRTRAVDNPVKNSGTRKSDKEGHAADSVANSLSGVILGIKFRRRGEPEVDSMRSLLYMIFDGAGKEALNTYSMTADRGFGNPAFV